MIKDTKDVPAFTKPTTVFQQKVNEILKERVTKDAILNIFELQLYKNAGKSKDKLVFVELYNLLGLEKFFEVLEICAGKTIKFPKKDDFKETLEIALSYYYRYFEHLSWSEIKEKLDDDELPAIKYGIKIQQLERFLAYIGDKIKMRINQQLPNISDAEKLVMEEAVDSLLGGED